METHIPPGKGRTVEDIIESMNRIFAVFQIPASLKIDSETTELKYSANQKLRLVLPTKLARAIGLLSTLDLQAPGFRQRTVITKEPASDLMFLSSDICQQVQCGSRFVRWLKALQQPKPYGNLHVIEFPNITYIPIGKTFVQHIHIDLCNDEGEQLLFGSQPVMVTLKVRLRREWISPVSTNFIRKHQIKRAWAWFPQKHIIVLS